MSDYRRITSALTRAKVPFTISSITQDEIKELHPSVAEYACNCIRLLGGQLYFDYAGKHIINSKSAVSEELLNPVQQVLDNLDDKNQKRLDELTKQYHKLTDGELFEVDLNLKSGGALVSIITFAFKVFWNEEDYASYELVDNDSPNLPESLVEKIISQSDVITNFNLRIGIFLEEIESMSKEIFQNADVLWDEYFEKLSER